MIVKKSDYYKELGSRLLAHLEEALHVLQDVDTAVAEVVLLRHSRAGALHHLLAKAAL